MTHRFPSDRTPGPTSHTGTRLGEAADSGAPLNGHAGNGHAGNGHEGLDHEDNGHEGNGHTGNGQGATSRAAPRHVAIIMDGNGRWAQARGLIRVRGHEQGVESVRAVTRRGAKLGLTQLTLFAFSTENWKRPRAEVAFLMRLLRRFLIHERDELMENNIRLRSIGQIEGLPRGVQRELRKSEALTADNDGMVLCLALNYGARTELADAARRLALDVSAGRVDPAELEGDGAEALLAERLYQPDMPPLDLLIRTAGEQRLSNFLLWQMSYGEFHVTDVRWPEFREENLEAALADYASRTRRFGGLVTG